MASAREDGIGGYLDFADTQSLFENSERSWNTQGKGGKYPQKGHKSSLEEHGYGPSKKKKKKKKDEKKAAVSSNNEDHGLNTAAGSLELNSPPPSQEEGSVVVADLASQKKKKSKKRKTSQEEPHHKEVHTLGALTWSYELHSPPPTEEEGSLVAGENLDASQKKKKKKRKTNQEELHTKENHDIDTSAGSLELYTMPPSQEEGSLVADAEGPEPSQKKKKSKKRKMNQEELHLEEEDYFDTQGSLAVIPPTQQSQDEQSDNVDTLQDTSPPLKKKKLQKDKKEMKSSSSAEGGKEALEFTTSVLSSGTKPVGEEHEKDKTAEKQVDGDTIKDTRPSHKKKEPQKDQKEKKSESFSSPKGVKRPLEFAGDFVSGSKPSGVERGRDVNAEKGASVVAERSPSPELFSQNQADPYEFTGSGDIAAAASTEQQTEDVPSRQHVNLPEERLQGSSEQGKTPASSKNPRQANTERGTKKRRKKKAKHRKTLGSSKRKRQAEEVPQLERSAEEEEEEVDVEEVASIREYQEAYRLLHNPTLSRDLYKKAEMEEFTKNTGLKIATGRFSEKERAKLKRNWTSFLKTYMLSEEFDPFCLLSTSHTPAHLKPEVARFRQTRGFYDHIGRGIARPMKSILYCARTMFDPRKDNVMTEEEQKHLKALQKKYGDHWIRIAEILNKPPKVLQNYSKNHFEPKKKGDWTDAEKQQLIEAIKEVAGPENLEDPKKRIAWKRVAESVPTRSDKQCRTAWLHRFIKEVDVETAGEFKVRLTDQQRIKLLDMVCKFEDAKFIKWDEIWKDFPELASPQKLNNLWASRFKAKVPGYKKLTFKEVCAWLKTHYRPDLVQRINGSSVRYKKTKTKSPHLVISGRFSCQF